MKVSKGASVLWHRPSTERGLCSSRGRRSQAVEAGIALRVDGRNGQDLQRTNELDDGSRTHEWEVGTVIEHDFQTTVGRSPEEVFDFLVDLRNAPRWEPNCQEVEKTSDGPIGKGTTFRAKKGMGRLESQIVEFERPAHFATRETGRGMVCGLEFRCDAENGGTQLSGKLWMEPHSLMRGLVLLMRPRMKRLLGELPDNLRHVIEAEGEARDVNAAD